MIKDPFSWVGQDRRMSKDYERLAGELGGVRICRQSTAYGEVASPLVGLFTRFLIAGGSEIAPITGI